MRSGYVSLIGILHPIIMIDFLVPQ